MAKYTGVVGYDWFSVGKHGWSLPTDGLGGMDFEAGQSSSTTLIFTDDDGSITRFTGTGLSKTATGISWTKLSLVEHLDASLTILENIDKLAASFGSAGNATFATIGASLLNGADLGTGSTGDDNMTGGNGNDTLNGGDGNDLLYGGAGADQIDGGSGNDIIRLTSPTEMSSNETINGGTDTDTVLIGAGTFDFGKFGASSIESLKYGVGGATAVYSSPGALATVEGSAGVDKLVFTGGGFGADYSVLSFSNWNSGQDVIEIQNAISATGTSQGDTFIAPYAPLNSIVYDGGAGDDVFVYNAPDAGSDVTGGAGADRIVVGDNVKLSLYLIGVEELSFTGSGAIVDFTPPNANYKTLHVNGAGEATNTLKFSTPFEQPVHDLSGLQFSDWLNGKDTIYLAGSGNHDKLTGTSQDDTIYGNVGSDTINGGAGVNTAVFDGTKSEYTITVLANGSYRVIGRGDTDSLTNIQLLRFDDGEVDVNDPPVIAGGDSWTWLAVENYDGELQTNISDPDKLDTLTLSIIGGVDAALFTIADGNLIFKTPPNFEAPTDSDHNNSYVVKYKVTDKGGLFDTQTLTINVWDDDEAPDITSHGGAPEVFLGLAENTKAVTTIQAADPEGASVVYKIVGGLEASFFTVNATTGALSLKSAPNFELPSDPAVPGFYQVDVSATDGTGHSSIQYFAVKITDKNEAPTDVTLTPVPNAANLEVEEGAAAGTVVANLLKAIDEDQGDTFTYSVNNAAFEIVGDELRVKDGSLINHKNSQTETINITAKDSGGLTKVEQFVVDVIDVPEPPTLAFSGPESVVSEWTNYDRLYGVEDYQVSNYLLINYNDGQLPDADEIIVKSTLPGDVKISVSGESGVYFFHTRVDFELENEFELEVTWKGVTAKTHVEVFDEADYYLGTAASDNFAAGRSENSELPDYAFGNDGNDSLSGAEGDDTLEGEGGKDRLNGEEGDDYLWGDQHSRYVGGGIVGNDTLNGGSGDDTLNGGFGNDIEMGGEGNDWLTASNGLDTLDGGSGDDTIVGGFDSNTINGGLGDDVANGGFGADRLSGNEDNDVLKGGGSNDTISGGAGDDTLDGGSGNDSASGDDHSDSLFGAAGLDTLNGGAGDDTIVGGADNDTVDGGLGLDIMRGGLGDDRFLVDDANDEAFEKVGEGVGDRVVTKVSYALSRGQEIEILETSNAPGTGAMSLAGNNLANSIIGNAGNNTIDGGLGQDTVQSGNGADRIVFSTALGAANVDLVIGFDVAKDTFALENGIFDQLATKAGATLAAGAFALGTAATDVDDRILFDGATGTLRYDSDGTGVAAAVAFATLQSPVGTLGAADFIVI